MSGGVDNKRYLAGPVWKSSSLFQRYQPPQPKALLNELRRWRNQVCTGRECPQRTLRPLSSDAPAKSLLSHYRRNSPVRSTAVASPHEWTRDRLSRVLKLVKRHGRGQSFHRVASGFWHSARWCAEYQGRVASHGALFGVETFQQASRFFGRFVFEQALNSTLASRRPRARRPEPA